MKIIRSGYKLIRVSVVKSGYEATRKTITLPESVKVSHNPPGFVETWYWTSTLDFYQAITKIIKQFTSGTSYLINGRLHVSVPTGPSSGPLMNQVINAAYMLGSQLCLQLV
jgi:hypothetical protein